MTIKNYQICSNCIMDTSDQAIVFDNNGLCDYCNNFYKNILPNWHTDDLGQIEIDKMLSKIKKDAKGRNYDCLLGISGGVDSSYLAYLAVEKFGLKPLIFHVDAGWNSQQAVHNIECIVEGLGLELHTEVVNWQEMKDLQLAYFKAQVPHLDTPQDHAFFASLYNFAAKYNIKYILNGGNYSTECVREPIEWAYHASDLIQLKDIHSKFGSRPLKTFPMSDIFTYKLYYRFIKGVQVWRPLNCLPYIKEEAMQLLIDKFGWQKYQHKHYESRFTRFYEGYWQPTKFGYDKRRAHFSSLILTKQMTREEALIKISQPAYDEKTIAQDFQYISSKLDISVEDLQNLHNGSNKSWRDYKSRKFLIDIGTRVMRRLGLQRGIIR
jgi:N-acetyl sugar amidotransferase